MGRDLRCRLEAVVIEVTSLGDQRSLRRPRWRWTLCAGSASPNRSIRAYHHELWCRTSASWSRLAPVGERACRGTPYAPTTSITGELERIIICPPDGSTRCITARTTIHHLHDGPLSVATVNHTDDGAWIRNHACQPCDLPGRQYIQRWRTGVGATL
jgi:hypothetical protein